LYNISKQIDIAVGIVFKFDTDNFVPTATFAYYNDEAPHSFKIGEGISGQVAKDKKAMFLNDLPSKSLMIVSGLGQIEVNNLAIIPILKDDNAVGLIEIATFKPFEKGFVNKIDEFSNAIGEISPL
jgi:GAF domain-containing protein